jgi:hypothetical protein
MEVSEAALRTLAATTAAMDVQEQRVTPLVKPRDSVQPVQPETPQLLPCVHVLWAPLVHALKVSTCTLRQRSSLLFWPFYRPLNLSTRTCCQDAQMSRRFHTAHCQAWKESSVSLSMRIKQRLLRVHCQAFPVSEGRWKPHIGLETMYSLRIAHLHWILLRQCPQVHFGQGPCGVPSSARSKSTSDCP